MPSKKDKGNAKRCKYCGKKIELFPGHTRTRYHIDTGKSESESPFLHTATPR